MHDALGRTRTIHPFILVGLAFALGWGSGACRDVAVDLGGDGHGEEDETVVRLLTDDERMMRVDPFFGSGGTAFAYGAGTPAAQHPNGLVVLGPDTTNRGNGATILHTSGYHASDQDVFGFSHLHFIGTGVEDFGNFRVLPTSVETHPWTMRVWRPMDKGTERATPGFYAVTLPDDHLEVELTATPYAGVHRYTAMQAGTYTVTWDTTSSIADDVSEFTDAVTTSLSATAIEGHVVYGGAYTGRSRPFTMHFYAELSAPNQTLTLWDTEGPVADSTVTGFRSGAQWSVTLDAGQSVELRVGVGPVNAAQARAHVDRLRGDSFEDIRIAAADAWAEKLRRIQIGGGTKDEQELFYSAMYRLWQMPNRWQGADGQYVSLDGHPAQGTDGQRYLTNLSLWDTFRTLHPLYVLIDPQLAGDVLRSLVIMGETGGSIPRWPAATSYTGGMVGFSAAHLFAEGLLKGITNVDYDKALAMWIAQTGDQETTDTPSNLEGLSLYQQLGYVPTDTMGHSVATTLEYARAYASLATFAAALDEPQASQYFETQADAWRYLFHPTLRFFRPRLADGRWSEQPDERSVNMGSGPYTEGSPWQYRFYAMHALDALVELWGDRDDMTQALETFFEQSEALHDSASLERFIPAPYYWHGNEPDIDAAYVFHALGRYDRVCHWVRTIQRMLYRTGPDGLPGNDDGGTLSAWYVWNAIGLYPVVGGDRYMVGIPLFPLLSIPLDDGSTLTIEAPGVTMDTEHVRQVLLNGDPIEGYTLSHADLRNATITFIVE